MDFGVLILTSSKRWLAVVAPSPGAEATGLLGAAASVDVGSGRFKIDL